MENMREDDLLIVDTTEIEIDSVSADMAELSAGTCTCTCSVAPD